MILSHKASNIDVAIIKPSVPRIGAYPSTYVEVRSVPSIRL